MADNKMEQKEEKPFPEEYAGSEMNEHIPVGVYRLLEHFLKEELTEALGRESQERIFRNIVYRAEKYFSEHWSENEIDQTDLISEVLKKIFYQLKEREIYWKHETAEAQRQAETAAGYNELLLELTRKRHEWIMVIGRENQDIMYCNKRLEAEKSDGEYCQYCEKRLSFRQKLLEWHDDEEGKVWEAESDMGNVYRITTFPIVWKNRQAYAHIVLDITIDKEKNRSLKAKAYRDQGTGIYNRTYFMEYMNRMIEDSSKAVLCYMDLDGLKYVNDNYGHLEGDEYIRSFVEAIQRQIRDMDIFARVGGDEFCAVLPDCPVEMAHQKMLLGLDDFLENHQKEYPASFSYGIVEIGEDAGELGIEKILQQADVAMYECKRQNKGKYHQREQKG